VKVVSVKQKVANRKNKKIVVTFPLANLIKIKNLNCQTFFLFEELLLIKLSFQSIEKVEKLDKQTNKQEDKQTDIFKTTFLFSMVSFKIGEVFGRF
jgi:hypothetical protein